MIEIEYCIILRSLANTTISYGFLIKTPLVSYFRTKKKHVYFVEPILFIVNATWQTISSGTEQHFFNVSRELSEMKNKKIASTLFWICVLTMFDLGYVDQRFRQQIVCDDTNSVVIFLAIVLLGQRMQCKNATFSWVIEYLSNGRIGFNVHNVAGRK